MNGFSRSDESSSARAELSGVLLKSVEEILREPMAEEDLGRALDRARQLGEATMPRGARSTRRLSTNHAFERIQNMFFAHKGLAVAAAAMTTLAVGLFLYVSPFVSPSAAYALDQTVQANDKISSYHVKMTPAIKAWFSEAWIELRPDGTVFRARVDFQEGNKVLDNNNNWPDVFILSEGKGQQWFKAKNVLAILPPGDFPRQIVALREGYDPKLAFEKLQAKRAAGEVTVTTEEPSKEGQPIVLTVIPKDTPNMRNVYEIDPKTKLVEKIIESEGHDDQWKVVKQYEFLDYNKEIDPKLFQLDLPKDAISMDTSNPDVGLPKGNLSDKEIAVKLVRGYFEAIIAKDYAKASKMYSGLSVATLEEALGRYNFLRIVSIGEPKPYSEHGAPFRMPVEVELELAKPIPPPVIQSALPSVHIMDAETATKMVREFYEALIAEDYEKAIRISEEAGMVDEKFFTAKAMKNLRRAPSVPIMSETPASFILQ